MRSLQIVQLCIISLLLQSACSTQYDKLLNMAPKKFTELILQPVDMLGLFGLNVTDINMLIDEYNKAIRGLNSYLLKNFEFLDFERKLFNLSKPCMNQTIGFVKALMSDKEWAYISTGTNCIRL